MRKNNNIKYETEESKEVKKFILVVISLVAIIVLIYFFTKIFVTKDLVKGHEVSYQDGVINYDNLIVGNMLSKNDKEYYVIAFDSTSNDSAYYHTLISAYKNKDKALNIYSIDLSNELNKKYIDVNKPNLEFTSLDNLKLGEVTLFKVKVGKVSIYLTNVEDIKKELAI